MSKEQGWYTGEPVCARTETNYVRDLLDRTETMTRLNIPDQCLGSFAPAGEVVKTIPCTIVWKRPKFSDVKKTTGLVISGRYAGYLISWSLEILRPASIDGGTFNPSATLNHINRKGVNFPRIAQVIEALNNPGDMCAATVLIELLKSCKFPVEEEPFLQNIRGAQLRMNSKSIDTVG